jgi:uncharacterized protein (DUF983 family)
MLSESWRHLLRVTFLCRCPRCAEGRLFSGFFVVKPQCEHCGLNFAKGDMGDGPAVFLIFILGAVLVPIALVVSMRVEWPLWAHAILWGILILAATLGLLQPARALTLALQYRTRPDVFAPPDTDK